MDLSQIEQSLLLATFFRGNLPDQGAWTSCSDQILTLSLFYTGDISADECQTRFSSRRYVGGLYSDEGEILPQIEARYRCLIQLLRQRPELIEGGGDLESPACPTYTACRLTDDGLRLIPHIIDLIPGKPGFPNWPDRRTLQDLP